MATKKVGDVREAFDKFLIRVLSGNSNDPGEIAILPQMVGTYFALAPEPAPATPEVTPSASDFPPFPQEGYVSVRQVAAFLGISDDTVYKRVKNGDLPPPVRRGPKNTRWLAEEIRAWCNREKEAAA